MSALEINDLKKCFGKTEVLRGVSLSVAEASLTAVLGPSGCGKTTLLRLIAGFDVPDSGSIRFGERTVYDHGVCAPPQRRRVGYVPQEGALFPHVDVAGNISFGLERHERRARKRVDELLELVGIDKSMARRFPHQLSGGQQQRVALARALAPNPSVVLLDEPFSSLDAGLRQSTAHAVADALTAIGATAVLVTHDQDEALSLADQVGVMRAGRLEQLGTPREIYESPIDLGLAEFVGEAVVVSARIVDGVAVTSLGTITVEEGCPNNADCVMVRPEQIRLMSHDEPTSSQDVWVEVIGSTYFGHDAFVFIVSQEDNTKLTARVVGRDIPPIGTRTRAQVIGPVVGFKR